MDRISIILQDKTTIEELAKDPEVQIRIKDAIVDALGKRSLKLMNANAEISNAVSTVSTAISREVEDMFFTNGARSKTLRSTYKDLIRMEAAAEFNNLVEQEVNAQLDGIRTRIQRVCDSGAELWERKVREKIANFDFDKAINEAVQAEVARRLGKR